MNATDMEPSHISIFDITQAVFYSTVFLLGLVGNILVIYVVLQYSKMHTVTNMYLLNLAIADECFLITIPMLIITFLKKDWIFGYYACKAYIFASSVQYVSLIFLCIISADRYIAVCQPIASLKWRTHRISRIVSLLGWIYCICLMLPVIIYSNIVNESNSERKKCVIDFNIKHPTNSSAVNVNAVYYRYYTGFSFICGFVIPFSFITIFYYFVAKKLKTVGPTNQSMAKRRSQKKSSILVLTVVAVYVLCWLPHWITQVAKIISEDGMRSFSRSVHIITQLLAYSNSMMNPILYVFLSGNFKTYFLKACTCAADRNDENIPPEQRDFAKNKTEKEEKDSIEWDVEMAEL